MCKFMNAIGYTLPRILICGTKMIDSCLLLYINFILSNFIINNKECVFFSMPWWIFLKRGSWTIVRWGRSFFVQNARISNSISLVISAIHTRRPPPLVVAHMRTRFKGFPLQPYGGNENRSLLNRVHVNYRPSWFKIPHKIWPLYFSVSDEFEISCRLFFAEAV